ncbi:hypothetical protein AB833_17350 [Chromatiales bacterium (ex Bugula neritina AB1)]|nr:hypothetical protein AB833_17350 [Chromatiales bacterium (ex Bugula neritina AB1)]
MRIHLQTTGLFKPSQFNAWSTAKRKAIHAAVKRGMQSGGRKVRDAARQQMRSAFRVKRRSFVSSLQSKVIDKKPNRLPALKIGSKIPWLGIHEKGGVVSGNLLIPLLPGRIGPKKFRAVVDGLMRSGNAYFIEKNGNVILMAENIRENTAQLSRFKRAERIRSGAKRIQRGQEIPIAVLVKSVKVKRRFNLARSVQSAMPQLMKTIERELAKT